MNKKIRHSVILGGTLALSALLSLSACGNDTTVNPYDLDFSVDTTGTSINFWTPFGSDIQAIIADLCAQFTAKTGINVTTETKGSYDNLAAAITNSASTKTYPNVALAYPDHMATYVNQDIIVRMDYSFENDGDDSYKISDFYSDYMAENQAIEPKEGGGYYTLGVPFNKSTEVMIYNKTFFDWAKTQPAGADIAVPTTWDELNVVGPKITNFVTPYFGYLVGTDGLKYRSSTAIPSGVGVLLDFSAVNSTYFKPFCYDSQANLFITACRQWGGQYTTFDSAAQKGYLAFDSDEVRQGLSDLVTYHDNEAFAIPAEFGGTSKYSSSYFASMMSVLTIGSSAGVANSAPAGDKFKVGVAPIPFHDAEHKFVISQGTNLVMLDKGTVAERVAAWKLVKFLSKEANGAFAARTDYFPSCEYAANSVEYTEELARDNPEGKSEEDMPSTAKQAKYFTAMVNQEVYTATGSTWTKFTDPGFTGSSTIRTAVGTAPALLFVDKKSPSEVVTSLYATLKDYVK